MILDLSGAQRLLGKGDMLFKDDNDVTRLQCPFIDKPEIVRICEYIKEQEDNDRDCAHQEPYYLPEYVDMDDASGGGDAEAGAWIAREIL